MFEITTSDDGTIRLRGRCDASQVASAAPAFDGVSDSSAVDLSEQSYISSAGLGLLFATQRRLVDAGRGLRLIHLNPHILEIFKIAGFDRIFEIE